MQKDFFNQNDINKFVKWTALHEFVKNCMDGTLQPLLDEMDNETNFSKFTLLADNAIKIINDARNEVLSKTKGTVDVDRIGAYFEFEIRMRKRIRAKNQ